MATSTVTPRRAHSARAGSTATARDVAPTSERLAQTPAPDLQTRTEELHVVRTAPKRTGLTRGRLVLVAPVLVLVSLLAVAGAQAVLTQGQVKLTNLQSQVSAAQTKRFDLELQVAQEEQPSAVIAAARAQGMTEPSNVTDLPAVNPGPTPTSLPTRAHSTKKTAKSGEASGNSSGNP
jgi:cell division protein FtsL